MGVGSNKFSTSIFISLKLNRKYNKSEVLGQSKTKELRFFALKNRKKGLITMSKLFMYGTSLEGIEQLAVECTQLLLPTVKFLDIPDMRPTTIYFINRVRASKKHSID